MANEIFSPTSNHRAGAPMGGVSSAEDGMQLLLRIDPTTKRLLVAAVIAAAPSDTGTHANVAGSASSVTLLAANPSRLGAAIFNDSTADLYVKLGATASATSFTIKLDQDGYYEVPFQYTGVIDGIWGSATGAARVVEFTDA